MKKIAILQSNYIPWKGYFDLIGKVDEFVFYDCVQYTKNDWRNRNRIVTSSGLIWLTIPVKVPSLSSVINDIKVADHRWATKHWKTIVQNYSGKPGYFEFSEAIHRIYEEAATLEKLSEINQLFVKELSAIIGLNTSFRRSEEFCIVGGRNERLIQICKQTGADRYVSGPSASSYLNIESFSSEGISVEWMDYGHYREYKQDHIEFNHGVSILDLLFNLGKGFREYI